jgi:outer membrane receptor for ferrienterochelin and colicins
VVVSGDDLNNPLEAQSSVGYNLGLTLEEGKWNSELNLFRHDIKNLIDTRIIARKTNGQNIFSYVNFYEIYTTEYKITDAINISVGYQLLYA